MKVENVLINGMRNPLGFDLENLRCSWAVAGKPAEEPVTERLEVSDAPSFEKPLLALVGTDLDHLGQRLDIDLAPRTRYYVRVSATDASGIAAVSDVAWFETAKLQEPWVARWIGPRDSDERHPVFRKKFDTCGEIAAARLYISGLGLFHATLNGEEVSPEILTPYYSDYHTEVQYLTFDVTKLLKTENALEVTLGNGWYKGKFGLARKEDNFGSRYTMVAELHMTYRDGTEEVVASDESWLYKGSDVVADSIYDGEVIDRTAWEEKDNPWTVPVLRKPEGKPVPRRSLPVVELDELPVREVIHTPAGETVLDFGQNFAGHVSFDANLPHGARITLDFGEILQDGNFYNANYRDAKSQLVYVSNGTREEVCPHFTYFGFRYCRVTGWPGEVRPGDFVGHACHSEMQRTGSFETGNAKVNRLYLNALWGQKSNSVDFPTDCPQRDERLGWTGDAQVFAGTGCYNFDASAFYGKFCHDLRVEQDKYDGIVPGVIPVLDPKGPIYSSVWGDIATFLPTVLYEHYGDRAALAEHYPMMRDWVNRIDRDDAARGKRHYLLDFGDQLGDWLALDGRTEQSMEGGTDAYFIASNYYAMSTRKVAEVAGELGYNDDARRYHELYEHIRSAIIREWFTPTGRLAVDTQTGYVTALYSGIYPSRERVVEGLRTRLYKDCFRIRAGFAGAPIMCRVMAENGMEADALHLLLNEDYPSWLHCVDLGATTIWERWNSVLDDGRLSGTTMNSLNHYAYGSVVEFLYRDVGGLRSIAPGFSKIDFSPIVDQRLGRMRASYASRSGTWRSSWMILDDGRLSVTLDVPLGCTARVSLPSNPHDNTFEAGAGHHEWTYMPTTDYLARYSWESELKDMVGDAEAMAVIKDKLPILAWYLEQGNEDFLHETLRTLTRIDHMGVHPDKTGPLAEALLALRFGSLLT